MVAALARAFIARRREVSILCAVALVSSSIGCGGAPAAGDGSAPPPPRPAPEGSASALSDDLELALAAIRPGSKRMASAVQTIAASGNEAALARADVELAQVAEDVASPAWRDAQRSVLHAANEASQLTPTKRQLDAQMDQYQDEVHAQVLALMEAVGGPASSRHCRAVALDATESRELREAALRVLERRGAPGEADALRARMTAEDTRPGSIPDAGRVIARLAPDFRRCWNEALGRDAETPDAAMRLELKITAAGDVASVTPSSLPGGPLGECLLGVVRSAKFEAPAGGEATLIIPLTLRKER